MTEPNDHAAERRANQREAAQMLLAEIEAAETCSPAELRARRELIDILFPPPEPERVWVRLSHGTEHTRDPDGKWWYRLSPTSDLYEYATTDADIKELASLVPGLVAQLVQPTAWYAVEKDDGWALRYANLEDARRIAANIHRPPVRIIPVVELPEVPRDA